MIHPNLKSQKTNQTDASNEGAVRAFAMQNADVVLYLLSLIDDIGHRFPHSVYSCAAQALDKKTIKTRFSHEGLSFATKALPLLSEGLFHFLETGNVSYPSFKIKDGTVHPVFLHGLFRLACSTNEYQVEAIRCIYQISVCFKKLKGPYPDSVLRKQYANFVATDKELADIDWFSDVNFPILQQARVEINNLFKNKELDLWVKPRPGPGATNTPVAKHLRYRPHVLYTQINDVIDYIDMFFVNSYDVIHQAKTWLTLYRNKRQYPRSRYKTVFKTFGKGRGICIEENEVQFMQQAYRRALYRIVERSPLTRGRINFSDQSINAKLALASSIDRTYATLDLSEASDRNARELVSWIFQDTTFHNALMALSTKYVDYPDLDGAESIKTFKYAPMGSALCFPVMSLLYWALCRSIIHLSGADNGHKKEVYVYGDDIVVPSQTVEAILTYLPRFGMKINSNKSFYRSHFRESCGVHAYQGIDITPVYVKHIPVTGSISQLVSCINVESQLFEKGFANTARLMRCHVESQTGTLPIVSRKSPIFGFKRSGTFLPQVLGRTRSKIDVWGNLLLKFRVVGVKQHKTPPPTELECYLRSRLTNAFEREIGDNPEREELYTRWEYVRWSQLTGSRQSVEWWLVHFPCLGSTHLTDGRAQRDVTREKLYDNLPMFVRSEVRRETVRTGSYYFPSYGPPEFSHSNYLP